MKSRRGCAQCNFFGMISVLWLVMACISVVEILVKETPEATALRAVVSHEPVKTTCQMVIMGVACLGVFTVGLMMQEKEKEKETGAGENSDAVRAELSLVKKQRDVYFAALFDTPAPDHEVQAIVDTVTEMIARFEVDAKANASAAATASKKKDLWEGSSKV